MSGTQIPKIKEFPSDGRYWRVDAFGAVMRNPNIPTEPYLQIVLSSFKASHLSFSDEQLASFDQFIVSDEKKTIRIVIGQLPMISIGSIWKDGICQPIAAGESFKYQSLQISEKSTDCIPASYKLHGQYLIPYNTHRFGQAGAAGNLLAIENNGDPYGILIPMMELIRFYYAVSTKIAHAIFTGALKHDLDSIINSARTGYLEHEDRFQVGLRKHITDEESWVLARIIQSSEAWNACSTIHDDLMRQTINNDFAHIKTNFPFTGITNLTVRRKRIKSIGDEIWRDLVLSIQYCDGPFPFKHLTIVRDNDGTSVKSETDSQLTDKKPYNRKKSLDSLEGKEIQSFEETDKNFSSLDLPLPTDRYGAIKGRKPDKPTKNQSEYRNTSKFKPGEDPAALGTWQGAYGNYGPPVQGVNIRPQQLVNLPDRKEVGFFTEAVQELNKKPDVSANLRKLNESTVSAKESAYRLTFQGNNASISSTVSAVAICLST